ncbi:DUF4390 domain-containing protein [Polynucleobacter sp. MWH-CaK5]|uniref:DUF4390 domain-containing protein n=1 Tax=Polynucleobacter sp. MWH-CaK5 TaxID=2689107 RepID=UPI001BFD21F0|nr:DUF4390 domain-containing protein [Polynucleobacter sp. MWH-CaK5]QWD88904.1 DUF4390 domain-containing protein [Polynucleobacter sp. MWH-CaK5]
MRQLFNWIAKIFLLTAVVSFAHANEINFSNVSLTPLEKSWALNADVQLELSPALEQLVNKGVTLHFVTEFQLTKKRWYWLDNKIVDVQRVSKISYQALTNQYRVTLGTFSLTAASLKQALAAVRTIEDWMVIDATAVELKQPYQAAVRIRLDTNQLAKPFQVNAINSKSWNLQSDWYRFDFVPMAQVPAIQVPTAQPAAQPSGAQP